MTTPGTFPFRFEVETPNNGRMGKSTVNVLDAEDTLVHPDHFDLRSNKSRDKAARALAIRLNSDETATREELERAFKDSVAQRRQMQKQAEAGSPEAANLVKVTILDKHPETISRPLCCVGGHGHAAAWLDVQEATERTTDPLTGAAIVYEQPLVKTRVVRAIIREDGKAFADIALPGYEPAGRLGFEVRLAVRPPDKKSWSGAGVTRYLAGERPDPAATFRNVTSCVDRFIDFRRSLGKQAVMCELTGCYIFATYLLDAFDVIGYLWPNGDKGAGKTSYLDVVTSMAYLGQLILAGSSYPTLRDLSDYGATLAFDDAENVMDVRKTDPDKRTLLLAGNRRGSVIAVKELVKDEWETRYISTYSPRLFSAIKLPDEVLGSRTIIVPLVRSDDDRRAKANPQDPSAWPIDQRRLVDDLWAIGLAHVSRLREFDRRSAAASILVGRDLDVWRAIFAVALWLDEEHSVEGLSQRMNELARVYQSERTGLELFDPVRVAIKALDLMIIGTGEVEFSTKDLTDLMNNIAVEEGITEESTEEEGADRKSASYTNTRKVGRLLARQRFRKATHDKQRRWKTTRGEVEALARAYGMALTATT
jgi:hypothetical protein